MPSPQCCLCHLVYSGVWGLQCQVQSAVPSCSVLRCVGGCSAKSTVLSVSPCVLRCVCVGGGGLQCQVHSAVPPCSVLRCVGGCSAKSTELSVSPCSVLRCVGVAVPG